MTFLDPLNPDTQVDWIDPVDWVHPLNVGCVFWGLGLASGGNLLRDVTGKTTGAPIGVAGPIWTATGRGDYGLKFAGAGQMQPPPFAPLANSSFSFAVTINLIALSQQDVVSLQGASSNQNLVLEVNSGFRVFVKNDAGTTVLDTGAVGTQAANTSYRWLVTFDLANLVYTSTVNNSLVASGSFTTPGTMSFSVSSFFGTASNGTRNFNGLFSDPKAWNYALPKPLRTLDYQTASLGYRVPAGPLRFWSNPPAPKGSSVVVQPTIILNGWGAGF